MFSEETLEILLRLLRPLTGLDGAECLPEFTESRDRIALLGEPAGVLGNVICQLTLRLVLRHGRQSEGLLFFRADAPAVHVGRPVVQEADPDFSFAAAFNFLDPALRRLCFRQAATETSDVEINRLSESVSVVPGQPSVVARFAGQAGRGILCLLRAIRRTRIDADHLGCRRQRPSAGPLHCSGIDDRGGDEFRRVGVSSHEYETAPTWRRGIHRRSGAAGRILIQS